MKLEPPAAVAVANTSATNEVGTRMLSEARLAACRANWKRRRGLTEAGLERLRIAAHRGQPWRHSTGPRTGAGKAKTRENALRIAQRARTIDPRAAMNEVASIATANARIYAAWARGRMSPDVALQILDASDGPMAAAWHRVRAGFGLPEFDFEINNPEHRRRLVSALPLQPNGRKTDLGVVWLFIRLVGADQRIDHALIDRVIRLNRERVRMAAWGLPTR